MRLLATCFALISTVPFIGWAQDESLQSLYDHHEWFRLMRAVGSGHAPLFFQAAVACALNKTAECERIAAQVLATDQKSDATYEIHSLLSSLYVRQGKYHQALREVDAMLRVRPNDADAKNTRAVLSAAVTSPDQRVAHPGPAHVKWAHAGSLSVPISVNGKMVNYFLDTGANISVMSDGDARRLGLTVRDSTLSVSGSAGQRGLFRTATANHISIGNFQLDNVLFLVFPESQPPFNEHRVLEQGLIGLPVLLAAKRVEWSEASGLRLGGTPGQHLTPNLAFDGEYVVLSAAFGKSPVVFMVDSGSSWTFMYPRFAKQHDSFVKRHGTPTRKKLMGFGGEVNAAAFRFPDLSFTIGEKSQSISDVDVIRQYTDQNSREFDGCLGKNAILGGVSYQFDFDNMVLTTR